MGFVRGSLIFFIGTVLLITLIASNIFLTLSLSANPENLKEKIVLTTDEIASGSSETPELNELGKTIDRILPTIEKYCQENVEYTFSEQGYAISLPCTKVSEGKNAIVSEGVSQIIDQAYSKNYECGSVIKCVFQDNNALYLFSNQAKQEWKSKFFLMLFISIILAGIIFLISDSKIDFLLTLGLLITLSSFPIFLIEKIASSFDSLLFKVMPLLFSESNFVFAIILIIGLAVITIGVLIKFFHVGHSLIEKMSGLFPKKTLIKIKPNSKKNSKLKEEKN